MPKSSEPVDPITAEELVAELRRLRARIPQYEQLTLRQARSMLRVAHLDPEFVEVGVHSISVHPGAVGCTGYTEEQVRTIQEELDRWTAVESELKAMTQGVAGANLRRRHTIGQVVLLVYAYFRALIRKREHADLIPWVERMRQTNRFGHKRKRT